MITHRQFGTADRIAKTIEHHVATLRGLVVSARSVGLAEQGREIEAALDALGRAGLRLETDCVTVYVHARLGGTHEQP
jgi:hypothetical protein